MLIKRNKDHINFLIKILPCLPTNSLPGPTKLYIILLLSSPPCACSIPFSTGSLCFNNTSLLFVPWVLKVYFHFKDSVFSLECSLYGCFLLIWIPVLLPSQKTFPELTCLLFVLCDLSHLLLFISRIYHYLKLFYWLLCVLSPLLG